VDARDNRHGRRQPLATEAHPPISPLINCFRDFLFVLSYAASIRSICSIEELPRISMNTFSSQPQPFAALASASACFAIARGHRPEITASDSIVLHLCCGLTRVRNALHTRGCQEMHQELLEVAAALALDVVYQRAVVACLVPRLDGCRSPQRRHQ
jgi:hypothetical protein